MALINEGLHILQEKVALRASDIDTIYVNGYGFPIYRGGPLFYADQIGLQAVKEQLMAYQESHPKVWKIAPLLDAVIESGEPLHNYQARMTDINCLAQNVIKIIRTYLRAGFWKNCFTFSNQVSDLGRCFSGDLFTDFANFSNNAFCVSSNLTGVSINTLQMRSPAW